LSELAIPREIARNKDYQFWVLQVVGWTGWVVLFAIRDFYWGQSFGRISLLFVDAAAGLVLTTALRYFYRAIWDESVWLRIVAVFGGSYVMAAIWQPIKNYSKFV